MQHKDEKLPRHVKTDLAGHIRDTKSRAVLNTNMHELATYRKRAEKLRETQKRLDEINTVKDEVESIKSDISDIKSLLERLVKEK